MQRPLSEHIARLEEKIVVLKRQLRADGLPDYQRTERELDLENAEQALTLFRKAYDLEQRIPSEPVDSNTSRSSETAANAYRDRLREI